ncbi:MAG: zf-TFIIB domain-containing protein [Pseudomonadota bacterium]
MQCPIDGTELKIAERQGVEIDYCPSCRGVWLDRGELDKIIDRSNTAAPPSQDAYQDEYAGGRDPRFRKKKRESFLMDLFDF